MKEYIVLGFNDEMEKLAGLGQKMKNILETLSAPYRGMKNMKQSAAKTLESVESSTDLVGKALLAGLGIYGGSKLLSIPEAYQRYGYYKNAKDLAKKQLEALKKKERR